MTKTILFIEGRRNGYSPEECGRTMTAGELIKFLGDFDKDTEIFICDDKGPSPVHQYGNITRDSIQAVNYENENDENEEE